MKIKKLILFIIVTVASISIYAQQSFNNKVVLNNSCLITLPEDINIKEPVLLDISELNFKSNELAKKYFESISDNILYFKYSQPAIVEVHINVGDKGSMSIAELNTYLSHNAKLYAVTYQELNNH